MNDKRYRIPTNRNKQSHSKNKENSTDNAISHTSRLIKYQTESMPRPLHHKLQSNNIKLARNDKDISASNKYHTIGYNNIKKTAKANKTAIGTEYNASQNFLKAFPDNIDTHLGIGDVLLNDDSILLTDSNLINDMIPNTTFDSNDLSNAKLNFNEWNMKIMSSNKEGFLQSSSSNSKNKMNEIIANVTPFNDTFQGNKLPVPHYQTIETIDEERNHNLNTNANTIKTYANTIPNSMLNSISDRGEIKKISNKIYSKNRNVNKPLQPKPLKTTQNYSFHNDSSSTRTTVGSLNNNKHNNQMIYHKPDHFNTNVNSADLGKVKANYSKEHRMKSKETIESKGQDTVMKYLKILFGEQLEAFNEKNEPSIKDLFRQLAFYALSQENALKESTFQNKKLEKDLKEKTKENSELSTQLIDIKSNLLGLIKTTDKITNKKTYSNKSLLPSHKEHSTYSLNSH